jgi:hypothetical protein
MNWFWNDVIVYGCLIILVVLLATQFLAGFYGWLKARRRLAALTEAGEGEK